MTELRLRKLYRGYVFTDFDGNEIGCKDTEQAMDEIARLLVPDKKFEESATEKSIIEDKIAEKPVVEKRARKTKASAIEMHRKIFERAKDQIGLTGKINGAQIAREMGINASNVSAHLRRMHNELEILIKKWQDEGDKRMVVPKEAVTNINDNKSTE